MWAFRDLNDRAASRARLAEEPAWKDFLAKSISLLAHMQAIVLVPAPFSAMR
jgi:NIPSNAP